MSKTKGKDRIYRPYTVNRNGMRGPITTLEYANFRAWGCVEELRLASHSAMSAIQNYLLHFSFLTKHLVGISFPFVSADALQEWRQLRFGDPLLDADLSSDNAQRQRDTGDLDSGC